MKTSTRPLLLVLAMLVTALVIAGCGSDSTDQNTNNAANGAGGAAGATEPAAESESGGARIDAKLDEWSIKTDSPNATSGKVEFNADNVGKLPHELVVLKTDEAAGSLKVTGGRVSEKDSVGSIHDIAAGDSKADELDLKPGKYVLVCNLPGHYQAGMYTPLTVK